MRNLLFILFMISSGYFAKAQDAQFIIKAVQLKVTAIAMPITTSADQTLVAKTEEADIAGIFVMKNSRVRRALSFKVKRTDLKLV